MRPLLYLPPPEEGSMAETPETLRADADFVERNWASMGVVSFGDLGRRIRAHADAWEAERAADKARIVELERLVERIKEWDSTLVAQCEAALAEDAKEPEDKFQKRPCPLCHAEGWCKHVSWTEGWDHW